MTTQVKYSLRGSPAAFALLALLSSSLNAQPVWLGGTSNTWEGLSNWSSANQPDTNTEVAQFNSVQANNALVYTNQKTIQRLNFTATSGSYSFTAANGTSPLRIETTVINSTFIDNLSGVNQTFVDPVTLAYSGTGTGTSTRTINTGTGGALTFGDLFTVVSGADRLVNVLGAGTVNFNGGFNATATNGFAITRQSGSAVINVNNVTNLTYGRFISTDAAGRINFNVSTARAATAGDSINVGSGRVFITTDAVSIGIGAGAQTTNFAGGNAVTNTIGVDVVGTGSGSIGAVDFTNGTQTGTTHILSAATDDTLSVTGWIRTTTAIGTGTKLQIAGPGVVRFTGTTANTANIPLEVASGRLELGKTAGIDAIGAGSITVNTGAELRLSAANQIADGVGLTLAGGTFGLNSFTEGLGVLNLSVSSSINLGSGGTVAFADSSLADWGTSTLSISGTFISGLSVRFGSGASALELDQLALISSTGFSGFGLDTNGFLTAAAIPEPSTYGALLGLGAIGFALRRRRA